MRCGSVMNLTGYVRAYKPEMKIKHYEEYRGIYCSLCRMLGKRYGLMARLALSYDFTFFAALLMSVSDGDICFTQKRCPFNPAKKCNFCDRNAALEYTADVLILTVYYKILDNINDDGFFKRLGMRLAKLLFFRYYKKAKRLAPEADGIISGAVKKQSEIEKSGESNIDVAADPSAQALSLLISLKTDGDEKRIFKRTGYLLGRWVYIADAYFDREEDRKKGSYNPFNIEEKSDEEIKKMLNITVGEMLSAYELLNVRHFDGVIRNVIMDGLYFSIENSGGRKNEKSL